MWATTNQSKLVLCHRHVRKAHAQRQAALSPDLCTSKQESGPVVATRKDSVVRSSRMNLDLLAEAAEFVERSSQRKYTSVRYTSIAPQQCLRSATKLLSLLRLAQQLELTSTQYWLVRDVKVLLFLECIVPICSEDSSEQYSADSQFAFRGASSWPAEFAWSPDSSGGTRKFQVGSLGNTR